MRELEALVMNVLWESPGPLTPGQVKQALHHDRELAYTTVMTVLVRLWGKGVLSRHLVGRSYAYRPTRSREQDAASRIEAILGQLSDRTGALTSFVDALPPEDRSELLELLRDNDPKP